MGQHRIKEGGFSLIRAKLQREGGTVLTRRRDDAQFGLAKRPRATCASVA
jgi:hypothetical protein